MDGSVTGGLGHVGKVHVVGIVVALRTPSNIPGASVAKADGHLNALGGEAPGCSTRIIRAGKHMSPEV